MTDPCCSGINDSHELACEENRGDRLVCWCCGATFPAIWECLWGDNGSRCLDCEECDPACRAHIGDTVEAVRDARSEAEA
jgi:hypothetical protein